METIIYQGQSIDVERVSRISGDFTVWSRGEFQSWHSGDEDLYRDAHGQYYLARSLRFLDYDSELERKASGRKYLHRISLKAAALWAVMRPFSDSDSLKRDLNAALAAPTSTSATRHFADGSMAVTLHLKPEPARLLRDACRGGEQSPVQFAYEALASHASCELRAGSLEIDDAIEAGFANHAPDDESDERTVVNLLHADGSLYARVPLEPDLEAKLDEMARKEGIDIGTALVNCLRRFHAQQQAEIVGATEPETITVPLTLPVDLYRRILAMGEYDERADLSETIVHSMVGDLESWLEAPDTDPSPTEFLEQFLEEHPLPTLLQQPTAYGVSQATLEAAARYAATAGRTVEEFIVDALELAASDDPGEALPKSADSPQVLLDQAVVEAISRRMEDCPWKVTLSDVVNGSLRFANLLAFADIKRACEQGFGLENELGSHWSDLQACIGVSYEVRTGEDVDENTCRIPILDVQMMSDERWHEITTAQAEAIRLLKSGEREKALAVLVDAKMKQPANKLQMLTEHIEEERQEASSEVRRTHRRHAKPNPADVALLAAAAPEAVDPVEEDADLPVEEHVDDPKPIRAVLADLAADWRAKAKEARTQAQDLQPFNASHKMHGQADLLEQCADTLAQAIAEANGEEGQ